MKLENILENEQYVLYVDLDGVMADLHSYVEKVIGRKIETKEDGNWVNDDVIWDELRAKNEPQFDKLELLPDAMKLWDFIVEHKPNILTATGTPEEQNAEMKRTFVKDKLHGYDKIHTVKGSKLKAQFAKPNHILIDDRKKSTVPWEEAGGIAILHTSADETIEELKKLGF